MATYHATIDWTLRDGDDFAGGAYSRGHTLTFDHGVSVEGTASPHIVPEPWSDPRAVDPEEAFVSALSSCHMLWFLHLAQRAGWVLASYRDEAQGVMKKNAAGKLAMTKVELKPYIVFKGNQPSAEEVEALHHRAHADCFIANSVTTEVVITPQAAPTGA